MMMMTRPRRKRRPQDSKLKRWQGFKLKRRRLKRRRQRKRRLLGLLMIRRSRKRWLGGARRKKRTERGRKLRLQDRDRPRNRRHVLSNRNNRPQSLVISSERTMNRNVPHPR